MFLGQFAHSLDAKGRLTIPVRFRPALATGAYVTQGFDRSLVVYTTESFERLAAQANKLTTTDPEARAVRRVLFGGATEVTLDSAGRILLPEFLRQYAGIESDAVLVGAGEYFEIWGAASWSGEERSLTDSESNARRFSAFDLSSG
jgi:MraZ protein